MLKRGNHRDTGTQFALLACSPYSRYDCILGGFIVYGCGYFNQADADTVDLWIVVILASHLVL